MVLDLHKQADMLELSVAAGEYRFSTARRKSKGASALGGCADLYPYREASYAQRRPQEKQLAFKSQKYYCAFAYFESRRRIKALMQKEKNYF
ncbi:MAG: hypothetical protein V7L29_33195 [Nostoc sp.]